MKAFVVVTGRDWSLAEMLREIGIVEAGRIELVALTGTTVLGPEQNCLIFDESKAPSGRLRIAFIADENTPEPNPGEAVVCHGWAFVEGRRQALAAYRS